MRMRRFIFCSVARGVTHGGDRGDVSPQKFELGGTRYTLSPQKMINIMVKYHAPTKTEQGKLNYLVYHH